jgi:glycerophosphoryl diester phosphodiesterase
VNGQSAGQPNPRPQAAQSSRWLERSGKPWVIAHRGDSFHAPENTLEAARRAWEAGADAWELDVRLTRDGVPVVLHDASLLRTTDVDSRFAADARAPLFLVADFDLDEIRILDAGSWFLGTAEVPRTASAFATLDQLDQADRSLFASRSIRIPTLAEALALTSALDWCVNIELKTTAADCSDLFEKVLALCTDANTAARVVISSFDHADVAELARQQPAIAMGVLTPNPLYRPASYVRDLVGAQTYHPSASALGADSAAYQRASAPDRLRTSELNALRKAGIPVYAFTVNDARPGGLADHLADAGVSGLFTDDPRSLSSHWNVSRKAHPRTRA